MGPTDLDPSGTLRPYPEICHRGAVRAAAYTMMVDTIGGWVADRSSELDWVTTTDLSVRMPDTRIPASIHAEGRPLRTGRRLISARVEMSDDSGSPFAYGYTSFARVPRRDGDGVRIRIDQLERLHSTPLTEPLADAAGVIVTDPERGATSTELTPLLTNPMDALQGAMTALIAEVAAVALADHHTSTGNVMTGLDLRYLSMGNVGPITTSAAHVGSPDAGQVRVEINDRGHDDRIIAVAFAALAEAPD